MTKLRWFVFWMLTAAVMLLFSWALLHPSMFFIHDNTQVGRISEMRLALEAGHFPVTWTQNFGFGYGMPLFLFYGPLPFYLAILATWAGWSDIGAMKLVFGLSGLLAYSGVFAWFHRRGWSVAIPAAVILLAAPYRAVDIYIRGALNEVVAIGILPWVLVGALLVRRSPRLGIALTSASVAALLLTHNLTALIGLPILGGLGALWLLLFSPRPWRSVGWYALGSGLGLLLSLFYVVPSLLEQSATSIGAIFTGYFDFRLHFLYIRQLLWERWGYGGSEFGPNDGMSFHLGTPFLIALLGSALLAGKRVVAAVHKSSSKRRQSDLSQAQRELFWMLALIGAFGLTVVMTLSHTQPLWEAVPLLQKVQFSWRFLGVTAVIGALLTGQLLTQLSQRHWRWGLGLVLVGLALFQARFHRPQEYLERPESLYSSDPAVIRKQTSSSLPDYIPLGFDQSLPPLDPANRVLLNDQQLKTDFNDPHRLRFLVEDAEPGTILWNIADFSGWEYYVDDQRVKPEILPDGRATLTVSEVPHSIGARFASTPTRTATTWISVAAFIVWLVLALPWPTPTKHARKVKEYVASQ